MGKTILIFGLGYSARVLARQLKTEGWRVIGTARSTETCQELKKLGYEAFRFNSEDIKGSDTNIIERAIDDASHILHSIPPTPSGDPLIKPFGVHFAKSQRLKWFGYLSTVGVYGDHKGAWVEEDDVLKATSQRGRARVAAEFAYLAMEAEHGLPVHVFRIAGIYGPGRGPLAKLKKGEARRIIKPGQVFNRIHVEDIALILQASMAHPHPGAIYNVADDEPAPPQDVISYTAKLAGLPVPEAELFSEAEMTEMGRSFYEENKRVSNRLIREELGVELKYPTYREGMAALLAQEPVNV